MRCKEIIKELELLAPPQYAEGWDNVGLLIGSDEKDVKKIMVALDASNLVIQQAIEKKVDMLITHHPMIFSAIKRVTNQDFLGQKIMNLIKNDISYYAMHTNYDVMVMNKKAADYIGLLHTEILMPIKENENTGQIEGIGTYGVLENEITLGELARKVKQVFPSDILKVIGHIESKVQTVAVSTGSGKNLIKYAKKAGVSVLITGDIDYHSALDAMDQGICIIDAGHFGTEHFMTTCVKEYLENKLSGEEIIMADEKSPFV